MALRTSRIVGVGSSVPQNVVTNADLEKILDTSDEWITKRSGIKSRRMFPHGSDATASQIGADAARIALDRAGILPSEINGIICATFTPDNFFPSTACKMQHLLGCTNAFAFDISAACAGFVYGLTVAHSMIVSGQCSKMLVIGAEIISKTLDFNDRSTAVLFGDGAGAVVLTAAGESGSSPASGILSSHIMSDGSLGEILKLPSWGDNRCMHMNGSEVFKYGVRMMSEATQIALSKAGLTVKDINLFVPHQANIRIISAIAEAIGLPLEKAMINLQKYGNTSSASIPLAFDEAMSAGRAKPGDVVVFTALGGGIVAGSVVMRL